jgi:hypothetical protein
LGWVGLGTGLGYLAYYASAFVCPSVSATN